MKHTSDSSVLALLLALAHCGLEAQALSMPQWRPLPPVERRQVLSSAGVALGGLATATQKANASVAGPRSVISVDSHLAIPVWPSWAGGRVVPVSLGGPLQDPFLLLAHHKHWFDPKDPLRGPFRETGKLLGLPYVDVEGFKLHPHRGFDIWTYVLDGSDGFRHKDSLGGSRVYRGGSAQWMRTGSGVLHEEFWETRPDRRTNIELFQLWVNLGAQQKFDPPAIRYIGQDTSASWTEREVESRGNTVGWVRDLTSTLGTVLKENDEATMDGQGMARGRPPLEILHVKLDPSGEFTLESDLNVVVYVREGTAQLRGVAGDDVAVEALQTATYSQSGDFLTIRNANRKKLDLLVLSAQPLGEPAIQAGPIVMNTVEEINDAYQQLQEGTFLDRGYALRQQQRTQQRGRA